ncbi:hypothetical protein [Brachybacterium sp. NPDC056505]|uniref:hypothetical protein n=1 Tax=Brachybacterium sp. NPDC056505 TaxID=3345843 RepID=UPI00366CD38B
MTQPPQNPGQNGWGSAPQGDGSADGAAGPPDGHQGYGQDFGSADGAYGSANTGYGGQGTGYGEPNSGYDAQNSGYAGQGSHYGDQGTGYGAQNSGFGGYGSANPDYGAAGGGYPAPPTSPGSSASANPYGATTGASSAPAYGGGGDGFSSIQQQGSGSGSKKWWFIGCGGCAILALLAVIAIIAVFALAGGDDPEPTSGPATQEQTTEPEETTASEEPSESDEPSEDATASDEAGGSSSERGTRTDPLPAGSTVTVEAIDGGQVDVKLGKANFDADEAIAKADQYNEKAPNGQKYILVPVTITYHGDGSAAANFDAAVSYVSADGKGYEYTYATTEHDYLDAEQIYDGASVTYDMPFLVPDSDKGDGTFKVSGLVDFDTDPAFVAGK